MTPEVSMPRSGGVDLPDYDEREISKIVYPETSELSTEKEFVGQAVKNQYSWVLWLLLAGVGFGVFVAACSSLAGLLIK